MQTPILKEGRQNGSSDRNLLKSNGRRSRAVKTKDTKFILVPTDFSESANRALDYAAPLANRFGAEVELMNVIERYPNYVSPATSNANKSTVDRAKKNLLLLADQRLDEWVPVKTQVSTGRPWEEICTEARKSKSDLIVISTHGYKGLKHLFPGSSTERVIRHAPCSVLAVRGEGGADAGRELQPRRILVPMDFSTSSKRALAYAADMAREFNAEIVLLNVVPNHHAIGEYDQAAYCLLAAEMRATGEKKLAQLVKTPALKGLVSCTKVRNGRPGTEITDAAQTESCDMIVISTHGWTGWNRVLMGSVTEEVVRYARCPVLVFRSNAACK